MIPKEVLALGYVRAGFENGRAVYYYPNGVWAYQEDVLRSMR